MSRNAITARLDPDRAARGLGRRLPRLALGALLRGALGGLEVALCLHRAPAHRRASNWQPELEMPAPAVDELLELLLAARPHAPRGWLTAAFDDGYADAVEYVASRAGRYRQVDFLVFACPEKAATRAGFRWDLAEEAMRRGVPRAEATAPCEGPFDEGENGRPELRALGDHPDYRLASVESLRALAGHPNVALGNHGNLHLSPARNPDALVRGDLRRSMADFERLFGPQRHYAFAYGTPGSHVAGRHVGWLRELGGFTTWTTEPRPFRASERGPGAVLPRFPVDGRHSPAETAGWIAARALDFRLRGRAFSPPTPPSPPR